MIKPLLIEVGVEELPAIPFLKELPNIKNKWSKILEKYALNVQFEFFYTPRRLVLWHSSFPQIQPDRYEEFFGAPKNIALKDEKPTPAALGFAKKCGVSFDELSFTKKDGKEVLYYKKQIKGKESKSLVGNMLEEFLTSLNFGKSMRWNDSKDSFIRPIRWIGSMLGDEFVEFEIFGVESKYFSYPHRSLGYEPFAYDFAGDYFEKIKANKIILFADQREQIILEKMQKLEQKYEISIQKDKDLLNEVIAITELPTPLLGEFDKQFLKLPPEVIVISMKEHQRYFPVFENGKLTNKFIFVTNAICDDYSLIVSGNEKVLHARLSDALFFWENDLKKEFSNEGLKDIVYFSGLGSLFDKTQREREVGKFLAEEFLNESEITLADKSLEFAKADLLSEMVYEFGELQGVMGYYYAKENGFDEQISTAIKEQYLPKDELLPSSNLSSVVAMAIKFDTIFSLFSIGKTPTGTKDPYALRRAAIGIMKIAINSGFSLNLLKVLSHFENKYKNLNTQEVEEFFIERMYQIFDVNPSVLSSILQTSERDITKISQKVEALKSIISSDDFKDMIITFKRVANIIKDVDLSRNLEVYPFVLELDEEKALYEDFSKICENLDDNYLQNLEKLLSLKFRIDEFFDKVMVNVEDEAIKQNRQNLIANIYKQFLKIADIKEISIH